MFSAITKCNNGNRQYITSTDITVAVVSLATVRTWASYTMPTTLSMMTVMLSYIASVGLAFSPHLIMSPIAKNSITAAFRRPHPQSHDTRRTCTHLLFSADKSKVAALSTQKSASVDLKGSWGSWAKVVSQREEQERVLEKIRESDDTNNKSNLLVRTGTKGDMQSISHLCIDTFRGPFKWWMLPLQLFQVHLFVCNQRRAQTVSNFLCVWPNKKRVGLVL